MIFWCLLSTLELLTVCLNVKVYWLMTRSLSTPQKWKDRSFKDLDFRFLGLRTIKRGCSMKSWGEIKSYTLLHPFAIWKRELCRNPVFGDFLGGDSGSQSRRLRLVKVEDFDSGPETPDKESGLPNSFFTRVVQASVAPPESLKRHSGHSEAFAPRSRRLRPLQAGDSGWHRRLQTPKSGDSGVSRPQRLDFSEGYK
jgi:hypothetical protein